MPPTSATRTSATRTAAIRILALLVAAALVVPASVDAAAPTPYGVNLVKNAGAEDGPGSAGYTQKAAPHWTHPSGDPFTVVRYGSPVFPTRAEATRINGGRKFFSCGNQATSGGSVGNLRQLIKIHGRGAAIDAGHVKVTFRGVIATYSDADAGYLIVVALDASDHEIHDGVPTPSVTASSDIFHKVHASFVAPAGMRQLELHLIGQREVGDYCDAYFDNISVKLSFMP